MGPKFRLAVLSVACCALATIPVSADWPMTGHDPERTNATPLPGPAGTDLLWSYTIDLPAYYWNASFNQLSVADNMVFWAGSIEDWETYWWTSLYTGYVYCFNATTGDLIWSRTQKDFVRTPTYSDGRLFLSSCHYDGYYGTVGAVSITCLDAATGNQIWNRNIYDEFAHSPVVADGVVLTAHSIDNYFTSDYGAEVVAIDAETGGLLWEYRVDGMSRQFIAIAASGGRVFTAQYRTYSSGTLVCLDLQTGNLIWEQPLTPVANSTPMVCSGNVLYSTGTDGLAAIDIATGALAWSRPDLDNPGYACAEGSVFVSNGSGRLIRLDPDTGEDEWSRIVGTTSGSPLVADGKIYLTCDGQYRCLDSATGDLIWADTAPPLYSRSIANGNLYCCRDDTVYCLNRVWGQTVNASIACTSSSTILPLDTVVDISLTNLVPDAMRRFVYQVNVTEPDGTFELNWHRGWQNVQAGETWTASWTHNITGLEGNWGALLFELEALDVTPAPWNQPPFAPDGGVVHDACSAETGMVDASLNCEPSTGVLPFASHFDVSMTNEYQDQHRRLQYVIDITLANDQFFPNWRRGWQNVPGGETHSQSWWQSLPSYVPLIGVNHFDLNVLDITPAPYNQAPYPPAGDTATDNCTITAGEGS